MIEKYLKIGVSTIVLTMMVALTWSVLNDKKIRDKMHANSLIEDQVKIIARKTVTVGKGIFTSSEEAEANIAKNKADEEPITKVVEPKVKKILPKELTNKIVEPKVKKTLPKAQKKAIKKEKKVVPDKKKLGIIWIVKPVVKVADLKINNMIKVVTNG